MLALKPAIVVYPGLNPEGRTGDDIGGAWSSVLAERQAERGGGRTSKRRRPHMIFHSLLGRLNSSLTATIATGTAMFTARAGASLRRTTANALQTHYSTAPWFVDDPSHSRQPRPPHLQNVIDSPLSLPIPQLPELPQDSPIRPLHTVLSGSPLLEPGTLLVTKPIPTPSHPLPLVPARGSKRRRGGTYGGEGIAVKKDSRSALESDGTLFDDAGIWNWLVLAQVKEGTEKRGAIETVARLVRSIVSIQLVLIEAVC
jgi:hypothetical protein